MIINIGDKIEDKKGRIGIISSIRIATEQEDVAAELPTSLEAKTYDTSLDYYGSISFGDAYWCYLNQVEQVIKNDELMYRGIK